MEDIRSKESIIAAREKHRKDASDEFQYYKKLQHASRIAPHSTVLRLVFDFAEKVLRFRSYLNRDN